MTDHWLFYLCWAVPGSALGGLARYSLSGWVARRWGERFPLGTLAVNVSGAFLIGLMAFLPWEAAGSPDIAKSLRLFLIYGFLGGFTTVSSFSIQTLALLQEGRFKSAGFNIMLSVSLCLAAVAAGAAIGVSAFGAAPRLSGDLPVAIGIVHTDEKIHAFLPHLDEMAPDYRSLSKKGGA